MCVVCLGGGGGDFAGCPRRGVELALSPVSLFQILQARVPESFIHFMLLKVKFLELSLTSSSNINNDNGGGGVTERSEVNKPPSPYRAKRGQ